MDDPMMNADAAAAWLGISKQTLAIYRVRGSGPNYCKLGRRVLYPQSELSQWVESRVRVSTTDDGRDGRAA